MDFVTWMYFHRQNSITSLQDYLLNGCKIEQMNRNLLKSGMQQILLPELTEVWYAANSATGTPSVISTVILSDNELPLSSVAIALML